MRWQLILWWHERAACAGETWYQCQLSETALLITCTGLSIKSLSGFIKSMFASLFFGCFFLQLQSSSCLSPPNAFVKMMMMSDRDFYILPQLVSYPRSPSAFAIGRRVDTCPSFSSLSLCTLHPPHLLPCLQTRMPVATNVAARHHHSRSLFFFPTFFFDWVPSHGSHHHPSPKWQKQ